MKKLSSRAGYIFPENLGMSSCPYINANTHTLKSKDFSYPNDILIHWLKIQQLKVVVLLGDNVKKNQER